MKFVDEATIEVKAGNGGPGSRHFRREKFVPLGGPDGGNGGSGGSVILVADRNRSTLLDFKLSPTIRAEDGNPGGGSLKDGKSGEDLIVYLPIGTQIFRAADNELVADLQTDGERFVLAKGGRGGKGNAFFKSATNRAPEHFQPGEPGEEGSYSLSLKLVADVGLIGFPNAGKSTLISRISAARPKIADYPFTTLTPNLGVVAAKGSPFVVADIPGLVPGAHEGKGLGIQFLKHVERTRVLAHLIDINQIDSDGEPITPEQAFDTINHELKSFSPELASKPQIVVLTKVDTLLDPTETRPIERAFEARGYKAFTISSASGHGIEGLVDHLATLVRAERKN